MTHDLCILDFYFLCLSELLFRLRLSTVVGDLVQLTFIRKNFNKSRDTVNAFQTYLCQANLQSFTEDYISTSLVILPSGTRTNIVFSNTILFPGHQLGFLDSNLRTLTWIASCPSSVISIFSFSV